MPAKKTHEAELFRAGGGRQETRFAIGGGVRGGREEGSRKGGFEENAAGGFRVWREIGWMEWRFPTRGHGHWSTP